jgi:hypothetical protein
VVDEEFIHNLTQQVHELWINPEVERRREAGRLPDDFAISRAQVIMNLDADAPEVRFNEEVKVLAEAEWAREVEYGEDVTEADVERIKDLVLTDHDPNAGLPRHRLRGPKHAYFDELVPYLERGQSLIVYHHLHHNLAHAEQVRDRLSQVEERLGPAFALRFRPGTGRAFFVVPAEAHRETLRERAARLMRHRPWAEHFTFYGPEGSG